MEEGRSKRKGLRVPVSLDVRCDLTDGSSLKAKIVNLGTEGVFIKSADPLSPGDLKEPYLSMIREYSLKMLNNEDLLRDGGILLVLDDLRNLPPEDRLKAYHILIKKGSGHVL